MNDTSIPDNLVGAVVGEDDVVEEEGGNKNASMSIKMGIGKKPQVQGIQINGATVARSTIPGATKNRNVCSGGRSDSRSRITGDIPKRYREEIFEEED